MDISLRHFTELDKPFILNSWLNSFYGESPLPKYVNRQIFFRKHAILINKILSRTGTKVIIASTDEDPDLILGYLTYEKSPSNLNVFHYIYIKRAFNGFGITKMLFAATGVDKPIYASHLTNKGRIIIEKYDLIYDPYFVLENL